MTPSQFFTDKLVVIRLNRLVHIPPARNSAELLSEAGLPVVVFEFGKTHQTGILNDQKLPTLSWGAPWAERLPKKLQTVAVFFSALRFLITSFRDSRPRLLETHGLQEQVMAWVLYRLYGIEYVAHLHEIYDAKDLKSFNRLLLYLERATLQSARFTINPSAERAAIYQKRYELTSPTQIVFNTPRRRTPAPDPDFYARQGISPQMKVLLYIGGLSDLNSSAMLIEAAVDFPENSVLVFAGWGETAYVQKLKARVAELGISSRVKFVGPVKDKWHWIDNADLGFCLYQPTELRSQYNAGPSNKLFEFISAGKPVVTNQAVDFRRIVEAKCLGATANPNDPRSIAQAVRQVLQSDLSTYAENARYWHEKLFHYEAQFRPALSEFLDLFSPHQSQRPAA